MNQRRSIASYRAIDLIIFAALLIVFEGIIARVSSGHRFAGQPYTVSLAAALTGIVFMRWGAWGAIHAVLSGLVLCFTQKATPNQYLIYTLGNLFSLFALPLYGKLGRQRISEERFLFLPVSLCVLLLMQAGRAIIALITGANSAAANLFFTTDSLSAVFTVLITWVSKKQDGLYEDQLHYLNRINDEAKTKEDTGESD